MQVRITDPLEAYVHLGYHELDTRLNRALELRTKALQLEEKGDSNQVIELRQEAERHMNVAQEVVHEFPNRMNDIAPVARAQLYDMRHGTHLTFFEHTLLGRFIIFIADKFSPA